MGAADQEFTEYVLDLMQVVGPVTARRMFGGHGIYHAGLMFGLVADDTLYLKVDDLSRPAFEARDLPAFEFPQRGRIVRMSYHLAPEEIHDDPALAADWARRAFEAALRSAQR